MEEKLVELLMVLNKLNESQEKIFGEFDYTADDSRKLEIAIRKCRIRKNRISFLIIWIIT